MGKVRSLVSAVRPKSILVLWAALLLPWVEGVAVLLSPCRGEAVEQRRPTHRRYHSRIS